MKKMTFKEVEDFVLNHIVHCSAGDMVVLYEAITGEKVTVKDWEK